MKKIKTGQGRESVSEEVILEAARRVFIRKGYNGARMQEIADEAKMNKALLHYYFRSKDKLFDRVFLEAFKEFWPSIEAVAGQEEVSVNRLIRAIVDGYMDILEKMPFLPNFVINELNRAPERVEGLILASGINPETVSRIFKRSIENGEMRPMDPRELLINIIGLCVFPVLARPLTERLLWASGVLYDEFLTKRRDTVYDFVSKSVLNEK
jgi:AcrR family transcriptional regulator